MAQPTAYNRAYNFSNYQAQHPADPLPAGSLDEELSRVKVTLDQIRANLAIIQRDDTAIANRSVGFDQLKTEVQIGINPPAPWAATHAYVARDTVFTNSSFYICLESHVSGNFAADLAAGKWSLIASFEAATSAISVTFDDSTADLGASTVQAAIDAIAESISGALATVAGLSVVATTGAYNDLVDAPTLALVATTGSYNNLTDRPTLGNAAAKNVGTTSGTVAAGDDSRITGATQATDLASTDNGKGAALVGVQDSGGNFTGTTVEAVLAELRGLNIGVDQTWQDVSASRILNTSYRNTTGRPIQISVSANKGSGSASTMSVQVSTNNSNWVNVGGYGGYTSGGGWTFSSVIIPHNMYYRVSDTGSGSAVTGWAELR